ncbi:hypothetical protein EXQ37_03385 [Clostridium botulinum]|nr:hypothetical protein [Clostridium botulinum]MBO0558889.1 hypothetical protein [Clostridium botulinum]
MVIDTKIINKLVTSGLVKKKMENGIRLCTDKPEEVKKFLENCKCKATIVKYGNYEEIPISL